MSIFDALYTSTAQISARFNFVKHHLELCRLHMFFSPIWKLQMLKHHWYPSAEKVTPAAWFVTYDYCIHISETWLSELILESRWADRRWTHRFEGTLVFNFFAFIYQLFNLMLSYFTSPYQSSLIQTSICVHRLNTSRHHLSEGFVY